MTKQIRVGIVGASPAGGWALSTHIPALAALDDFTLVAVATSRLESAEAAKETFGVERSYADANSLIADDVDVVTVSVKVPHHYEIVKAALNAGRHVYCEWPLAATTEQAIELSKLATAKGVGNIVGLQSRGSAVTQYLHDLVASGRLGQLRFVSLSVERNTSQAWATPERAWMADRANGGSALAIAGGHNLDFLRYIAGDLVSVASTVAVSRPQLTVEGSQERVTVTAPDVVLVNGRLVNGAFVNFALHANLPYGPGARFEIHGTDGVIVVVSPDSLQYEDEVLSLSGAIGGAPFGHLEVPERYQTPYANLAGRARNIAGLYRRLAAAMSGEDVEPSFTTAVKLHQLLDDVEAASAC